MVNQAILEKYGFNFGQNGAHAARSIMLKELQSLFESTNPATTKQQYRAHICELNVLDKPTSKARALTYRHLIKLYGMSNEIPLFRVFRKLWSVQPAAQPAMALQLAIVRDPLLRLSLPLIMNVHTGTAVTRQDVENILSEANPDRFSPASLKSFAQNINGSWTQSGFLRGHVKKVRSAPEITPINVAFALFLTYLEGATGERLLRGSWCRLLGLADHQLVELAIAASHRGIIDFKQSGGVTDVRFPNFLTKEEERWRNE